MSYGLFKMVDAGLVFFTGMGVVTLGLTALEKAGLSINESLVRIVVLGGAALVVGYGLATSSFLYHLFTWF